MARGRQTTTQGGCLHAKSRQICGDAEGKMERRHDTLTGLNVKQRWVLIGEIL